MKANILIDYLTFSVKSISEPEEVIRVFLGMNPQLFTLEPFGLLGYNSVLAFNGIKVCFDPRENGVFQNMGICVSMSGNGCRTFENTSAFGKKQAFMRLFELIHTTEETNCSRVDIACDDHFGSLDMETIIEYADNGQINSRIRKVNIYKSKNGKNDAGSSVYIGAPSSMFRIRIYDKAKEQFSPDEKGYNEHWVRLEMVLRDDNANSFVACMCNMEKLGELAVRILNGKVAFIENDDSNISRCSLAVWWVNFVQSLEEITLLSSGKVQHMLETTKDWFTSQMGPTVATLIYGMGWRTFRDIIEDGMERMKPHHKALADDYRNAVLKKAANNFISIGDKVG